MTTFIATDGAPFQIEALDAQFGGRRKAILKASCVNGISALELDVDVTLTGKLTMAGSLAATVDVAATRDVTAGRNLAAVGTVTGAGLISTGNVGSGQDVVSGRDVTAVRKMTVNGALVMAGNPFVKKVAVGRNGVGAVALAGVKQGDTVMLVLNLTDNTDDSAKFENPISDPDNIGQIVADDLSAKTMLYLVIKQS